MNEWNDICAMLAKYNGIEESFPKQKFTSRRNRKKTVKHEKTLSNNNYSYRNN